MRPPLDLIDSECLGPIPGCAFEAAHWFIVHTDIMKFLNQCQLTNTPLICKSEAKRWGRFYDLLTLSSLFPTGNPCVHLLWSFPGILPNAQSQLYERWNTLILYQIYYAEISLLHIVFLILKTIFLRCWHYYLPFCRWDEVSHFTSTMWQSAGAWSKIFRFQVQVWNHFTENWFLLLYATMTIFTFLYDNIMVF